MANIRSGNVKVSKMKREIAERLSILSLGYGHKRVKRQLEEGRNFLDMIEKFPYRGCDTVSKLKKKISEERNKLKERQMALDVNMPGHQFSLFEIPQEVSEQQQIEISREQLWLEGEIKWLHKCLGMCSNRDYFK